MIFTNTSHRTHKTGAESPANDEDKYPNTEPFTKSNSKKLSPSLSGEVIQIL